MNKKKGEEPNERLAQRNSSYSPRLRRLAAAGRGGGLLLSRRGADCPLEIGLRTADNTNNVVPSLYLIPFLLAAMAKNTPLKPPVAIAEGSARAALHFTADVARNRTAGADSI